MLNFNWECQYEVIFFFFKKCIFPGSSLKVLQIVKTHLSHPNKFKKKKETVERNILSVQLGAPVYRLSPCERPWRSLQEAGADMQWEE